MYTNLNGGDQWQLRVAEDCIARQGQLAQTIQAHGNETLARQAREMLALYVKSYLTMYNRRVLIDQRCRD
jgi:hypothetical protein